MHYDYGRSLLWHFFFCCSYSTTSLGKGLYYYLVLNAQQCPCWWRDQMMVRKKDTFWIIFLQAFSLHYVKHTVWNLSFLYKIELGKIQINNVWIFEFLSSNTMKLSNFKCLIYRYNLNFRAKNHNFVWLQ